MSWRVIKQCITTFNFQRKINSFSKNKKDYTLNKNKFRIRIYINYNYINYYITLSRQPLKYEYNLSFTSLSSKIQIFKDLKIDATILSKDKWVAMAIVFFIEKNAIYSKSRNGRYIIIIMGVFIDG